MQKSTSEGFAFSGAARPIADDVTVLIPTLGRDLLQGCLQAILGGTMWPRALLAVDQSSSPKVAGWLQRVASLGIAAEHIPSNQRGVAAARNRGLERVRTQFVAITDDDCQVAEDWLERMVARLHQTPHGLITGRVEPGGGGVVVSTITDAESRVYTRPLLTRDVFFPGNSGFALSTFLRIGAFDESAYLRSAEDSDWSYRALRLGVPVVYAPEVVLFHLDWRDEDQLLATYRAYARSQGGFYGKHLRRGDWFIALRAGTNLTRAMMRWTRGWFRTDKEMMARGRTYLTNLPAGIKDGWRGGSAK